MGEIELFVSSLKRDLKAQILCVSKYLHYALYGPLTSDLGEELRMSTQITLDEPIMPD